MQPLHVGGDGHVDEHPGTTHDGRRLGVLDHVFRTARPRDAPSLIATIEAADVLRKIFGHRPRRDRDTLAPIALPRRGV